MKPSRLAIPLMLALGATLLPACGPAPQPKPAAHSDAAAPTNRVDINQAVRQNLGITFAKVESRAVSRTLRLPGRFELTPEARREYRTPSLAIVEVLVGQYQPVETGTPLYRLDSPRWRELQRELTDAQAALALAEAAADSIAPYKQAHERHHAELEKSVELWSTRVRDLEALQAAGAGRADELSEARASLGSARAALAETFEKEAELTARERDSAAALAAARVRLDLLLASASSLTGLSAEELTSTAAAAGTAADPRPRWHSLTNLEVRALAPGVVDTIHATSGSLAHESAPILTVVAPTQIRFRAHALQSDLGRLNTSLPASVVAPTGGTLTDASAVAGSIAIAPTADPDRRTIDVIMSPTNAELPMWARAGVAGYLELTLEGTQRPELAIPLAAVVRDGPRSIIFRRDPANPDKAIRMEADLGLNDGRWVVINSGVAEGNEVVLDGVYQLMVATSSTITKGGHFHPDGSFHEGDH